jgi:putative PEP-CTERM/exosortase system-associated acyltransferase
MITDNFSFDRNFEVFLANTPESKALHYHIRYQVYCDEMGYEDKERFPDQLEIDDWDNRAVHFIVLHKQSGSWVGALRLVLNDNRLPFQDFCSLENEINPVDFLQSAELSRLCVLKDVRRYSAKKFAPYGMCYEEDRSGLESPNVKMLYSHKNMGLSIMWGLLHAAAQYCDDRHTNNLYLLVAPALVYTIKKEGFCLEQIGEPCEHRGTRLPFQWSVADVLANPMWKKDYKAGFRLFSERLSQHSWQKIA